MKNHEDAMWRAYGALQAEMTFLFEDLRPPGAKQPSGKSFADMERSLRLAMETVALKRREILAA